MPLLIGVIVVVLALAAYKHWHENEWKRDEAFKRRVRDEIERDQERRSLDDD